MDEWLDSARSEATEPDGGVHVGEFLVAKLEEFKGDAEDRPPGGGGVAAGEIREKVGGRLTQPPAQLYEQPPLSLDNVSKASLTTDV